MSTLVNCDLWVTILHGPFSMVHAEWYGSFCSQCTIYLSDSFSKFMNHDSWSWTFMGQNSNQWESMLLGIDVFIIHYHLWLWLHLSVNSILIHTRIQCMNRAVLKCVNVMGWLTCVRSILFKNWPPLNGIRLHRVSIKLCCFFYSK